jgi:hypothetical protein
MRLILRLLIGVGVGVKYIDIDLQDQLDNILTDQLGNNLIARIRG